MENLLNLSARPGRCHCPICERPDRQVAVAGIWWAPDGIRVGMYGICEECCQRMQRISAAAMTQEMTNVEAWLLAKYPETAKRLPKGYRPVSTRTKKENPNE